MSKSIILSVTISDNNTGVIEKQIIKCFDDDAYAYEVRKIFEETGETIARIVDPNYYID